MTIENILQNTIFNFPIDQQAREEDIRTAMKLAYAKSPTARTMFDNWVNANKKILISFQKDTFRADPSPYSNAIDNGKISIDLTYLDNLGYIDYLGRVKPLLLVQALVHEFGHALRGKEDNITGIDYLGDNARYVNQIWQEINADWSPILSYTGQGDIDRRGFIYSYTNGQPIDTAVRVEPKPGIPVIPPDLPLVNWDSSLRGVSRDLLLGGPGNNILQSGEGNDFLFGAGGNDILDGGKGQDTAVYFGVKSDYDIRKNLTTSPLALGSQWDGTWTVRDKRFLDNAGTDTLKNIEFIQFDDKKYELKTAGLTFQSDFALVIDTTGSMGSSINSVKAQASSLIEALFADGQDSRIGVVSFKDTEYGEPSQVILPFTDQDNFADRKAAAIAAINSITVSGGGDWPETGFDGLLTALKGSMGQWRPGASTLRIALFTDAPIKDSALASEVTALAQNIGAMIGSSSTLAVTGGSVNTFNLTFGAATTPTTSGSGLLGLTPDGSSVPPFVLSNEPIEFDPNAAAQVQIFTIFTGPAGTNTAPLAEIASANNGTFLNAPTNDELVKQLLAIINAPPVTQPPTISIANISQAEGKSNTTNYDFDITLNKPSTETVTVKYATADGTATTVSDYTAATGTVTFNPGETSKTVNISVKGDTTLELDETFTVNLTDAVGGTISKAIGTGTIIDDDRPVIALTTPDANASEDKKDPGLFNITRTGITTQALTVTYTISGTATNDTDYKQLTGTATFKAGSAQASIEIKPIDDKIYEGTETVILTLNDGGTNYKIDPVAKTGTVTITDDDLPSISLKVTDDKAAETKIGEVVNPGQFTLKRTGITTDALTVSYTIDGSASNGIDYQNLASSITFAAGSDTAIIDVKPIDDQFFEGTETVKLKLSEGSNYTIDGEKSGTIKIADNDNPRNLVLKVENFDEVNPRIGTALQTGTEGEVIDLRGFDGQTLKVDTIGGGDSIYKSYIGFYAVEDTQGTLANGLKVSDAGYAEAAIKSALLRSFKTDSTKDFNLTGGKILAPVVIANGTFEDYLKRNPQNQASSDIHAYFNYIGANTDKVDHFRLLGDNKFGIEDTYGGGDRDYNDIIFQMNVKG